VNQPRAAFYCVSSARYFLGAVALVNSLRLLGHPEPIFVLDAGLSALQRQQLEREATVVSAPGDTTPFLLKTVAPHSHPAEVMVLIDADVIVTRPLTDLIDRASEGRVLVVEHEHDRFFPQWGELLGLRRSRRRHYVSSGFILAGGAPGGRVVELMHEAQPRIGIDETPYSAHSPDLESLRTSFQDTPEGHPFFFADQDVLNAVLSSEIAEDEVETLDRWAEASTPFDGLRVLDAAALRSRYDDGTEPYVVHHYMPAKPWLERTYDGPYSRLLRRLLARDDVAIRLPKGQLPLRLRRGPAAYAERKRINTRERLRWRLQGS
jgi:hypothetical protein